MIYTRNDLDKELEKHRDWARIRCSFIRPMAGSIPANQKGVEAFVQHHMHISPKSDDFKGIVDKIIKDELGAKSTTPPDGELDTEKIYNISVIRSNDNGFFLLEHMIKANIKASASRLKVFSIKKGTKGDMAEMGTIAACGISLIDEDRPWEVFLSKDGKPVAPYYQVVRGTVSGPKGSRSILSHVQFAPEGTEFEFKFHWGKGKLSLKDIIKTVSAIGNFGIGGCRSLGFGKFHVVELEIPDEKK